MGLGCTTSVGNGVGHAKPLASLGSAKVFAAAGAAARGSWLEGPGQGDCTAANKGASALCAEAC